MRSASSSRPQHLQFCITKTLRHEAWKPCYIEFFTRLLCVQNKQKQRWSFMPPMFQFGWSSGHLCFQCFFFPMSFTFCSDALQKVNIRNISIMHFLLLLLWLFRFSNCVSLYVCCFREHCDAPQWLASLWKTEKKIARQSSTAWIYSSCQ